MSSSKQYNLDGIVTEIRFSGSNAWLRNDSDSVMYASIDPDVQAEKDGVVAIMPGGTAAVYGADGKVYISGSGLVQLIGSDYSTAPFSAGGSANLAIDQTARSSIAAHTANSNIHVTAEEKQSWNAKFGAESRQGFVNYLGHVSDMSIINNYTYRSCPYECVISDGTPIGLDAIWWHLKYLMHIDSTGYGVQIAFPLTDSSISPKYRCSLNDGWGEWKSLLDASSLAGKTADDFVLKAEYEALAARVSALENK